MSGTVADTALQIIAATASDAGVQLAVNWLNQRYSEFSARARLRQNRHFGSLYAPSPITLPTVTTTLGSTAITFSTPPLDPVTGSPVSVKGWQIRSNINWYWVTAHTSNTTTATIDTPFSETGAGSGLSCTIVKRALPVSDPNARWVSNVYHQRRRKRLRYQSPSRFQELYPGRTLVGAFPWTWTETPRFIDNTLAGQGGIDLSTTLGTTGQKMFEVYPPSNQQETYMYLYWTIPQAFLVTDTLPPEIDEYVLREGVLVDVYRYKAEQWAAKGNVEMAGYYANQTARQMTIWERKIQEGQVTDALFHNDVPIELDLFSDSGEYGGDIITAHDWIISDWTQ